MKSKETKVRYIELPLKVFMRKFPELAQMIPPVFDVNDDNYIVRMKEGRIEIGYTSDAWLTE